MDTSTTPGHRSSEQKRIALDKYYQEIQDVILSRQSPVTGLLPASTAVTVHGDYTDAWVRDNVYSILAPWGLALAYRRADCDSSRAYLLEQSVVKLMRGLLICMMKQSAKVEAFKHTLNPMDALHAKYNTHTGDTVVADDAWGHLQLDATSLFLLMVAQMTASGLRIIYTLDEVNFIQNLVHYISRSYLTPDFGLWERGAKTNVGNAEINASSVGMAKAALEAMRGFDVFGSEGGQMSVIHVVEDDIANARDTLEALLPRESASKEIDAALLSIIGYPAYAIEDPELVELTRSDIVEKLEGRYGCKRFLRDGHQTVPEAHDRLHYETGELQAFENIESEWPLFFTYLQLDGLLRDDTEMAARYQKALQPLFVERDGQRLLPELYMVPADAIAAEKENPHSQDREPNENLPLVWAQSLSLLGDLLREKYLFPSDIDPLDRRWRQRENHKCKLLVTLLSENQKVQSKLHEQGIATQTPEQIAPIQVATAAALARAYCTVGANSKLSLTGRPERTVDTLTTSQLFILRGQQVIFLPPFLQARYSYLELDNHFLVQQLRNELKHIQHNWQRPGRPLLTVLITRSMLATAGHEQLTELLRELQSGLCEEVETRTARVAEHLPTVTRENIDHLHGFELRRHDIAKPEDRDGVLPKDNQANATVHPSVLTHWRNNPNNEELLAKLTSDSNIYAQADLLGVLWTRLDIDETVHEGASLRQLAEEVYHRAAYWRIWGVMRRAVALLGWYDEHLQDELQRLVIRGLRVAAGRSFSEQMLIQRPLVNREIVERIRAYGGDDPRVHVLLQEMILLLGKLIKTDPDAFKNTYTLHCWHLLLQMNGELAWERKITEDEAFDALLELNPQEMMNRLHHLLTDTGDSLSHLSSVESLHILNQGDDVTRVGFKSDYDPDLDTTDNSWLTWRKARGGVVRLSNDFCAQIWDSLGHCEGLVIGDRLNSQSRIDSQIVRADMTPAEKNFALLIEDKLNLIQAPEYRQLVVEALQALAAVFHANPQLELDSVIVLDVLIGHAVRIHAIQLRESGGPAPTNKSETWDLFFETAPHQVANAMVDAFYHLVDENLQALA